MSLEREHTAYRTVHLPGLLAEGKEGKFALVKGDDLIGVYDTFGLAIEAGYDRWLQEDFFVKQVMENEPVRYFSRDIKPCR